MEAHWHSVTPNIFQLSGLSLAVYTLDVSVVRPVVYGLNTPYRLWLAASGTSLTLETSLETASTDLPHINLSEN